MSSLLAWIPSSNKSIITAMVVASLLPFLFSSLARVLGGFQVKDNQNPRAFLANLSGLSARANAVQQNSFETLPVFLASIMVALLFFVPVGIVSNLAWLYVIVRVLYGLAYLANWATFRSILWALSMACSLLLFVLAIRFS